MRQRQDDYCLKVNVTEDHIYYGRWASSFRPDDPRQNAIVAAIQDAGVDNVKLEIYLNQIPPRHDWGIFLNGKRYAMTYAMRSFYDDFRIHHGHRTEPAILLFSDVSNTVDVRIVIDNRTPWEKEGLTYMQWHEKNLKKYGKPKPLTPIWAQQDTFPDWLKAKHIKAAWEK